MRTDKFSFELYSKVNDTIYRDVCKQFLSDADLPLSCGLYSMLGRAIGFKHLTSLYDIISLYGISLLVILFFSFLRLVGTYYIAL